MTPPRQQPWQSLQPSDGSERALPYRVVLSRKAMHRMRLAEAGVRQQIWHHLGQLAELAASEHSGLAMVDEATSDLITEVPGARIQYWVHHDSQTLTVYDVVER